MAARDREFVKLLGLSQRDIAEALDRTPQSISMGLSQTADYFNLKKLNLLEAFILRQGGLSQTEFATAKRRYLSGDDFPTTVSQPAKATEKDFTQLWIVSNSADAECAAERISTLVKALQGYPEKSVALIVPDPESLDLCFQALTASLLGLDNVPQVYLLEFSGCGPCSLEIFDPQTSNPRVYTETLEGGKAALPPKIVQPLIRIFKSQGYGISGDEFFRESHILKNSSRLKLRYLPDNFFHGQGRFADIRQATDISRN